MPLLSTIGAASSRGFGQFIGGITPPGQDTYYGYDATGDFSWVAPAGIESICVAAVGQAGNGIQWQIGSGGGGLGYKNNITVVPGNSYDVKIALRTATGYPQTLGNAHFINATTCMGGGGGNYQTSGGGGNYAGDGGGNGGEGATVGGACPDVSYAGSGGGAGGYSGAGGDAGDYSGGGSTSGAAGSGGGGGGGRECGINPNTTTYGGGHILLLGEGSSGASSAGQGNGGSGGANGGSTTSLGGGAVGGNTSTRGWAGVRILWGAGRAYPSTNTGDV
jgi:hypothetical protein